MDHPLSKSRSKVAVVKKRRNIAHYYSISKNGIITGAAANDPANIAVFAQVGAIAGLSLTWLLVLVLSLAAAIGETSAKIGIVAKKGLGTLIRQQYGMLWAGIVGIVVATCNIITIGADIAVVAEIIGDFINVAWIWLVLPIAIGFYILLLKVGYSTISRYLIIVAFVLLLYLVSLFNLKIDSSILKEFYISFGSNHKLWLAAAMALIGTFISPYLIFWQTTEEVEEKIAIKNFYRERTGVIAGFIYTGIIALAIIIVASITLPEGSLVNSAKEAALMLKPLAGNWAFLCFSLGIIASGLIAIPVLVASTAYTVAELFNLPEGLNKKFQQAKGFYMLVLGALLAGVLITFLRIPPMILLFYTQIIGCILSPILIIFLLLLANNKKVMGKHRNSFGCNLLGIMAIILMVAFSVIWLLN